MSKLVSAGLMMYARRQDGIYVLLAHPGGPFFASKDEDAWSIPKGLLSLGEDLLAGAQREFVEETGYHLAADTEFLPLGDVTLKSGKIVQAWAFLGEWKPGRIPQSNTFSMEWPPRSGRQQAFPEIDRADMFHVDVAARKINQRQGEFLHRLLVFVK